MKLLVIDVGGTHVKILVSGERRPRKFASGPKMTPNDMVAGVKKIIGNWKYDGISIGVPGPVLRNHLVASPPTSGGGWLGFDFPGGVWRTVKVMNDAAMQALGTYKSGKMLFLGLGTELGSTLVVEGIVVPMELGHLPYKKATFESYVGNTALKIAGKKKWRKHVADVVGRLTRRA